MSEKEMLLITLKYQLLGNIILEKLKTNPNADAVIDESVALCKKIIERLSNETI